MTNIPSPFRKSFNILNTFLTPVVVAFLLDRSVVLATLKGITDSPAAALFVVLLHVPFKVYIFSGLYGALIEMAGEQKMIFSLKDFKRNAKECWIYYLVLAALPILAHYLLFSVFRQKNTPLMFVTSHLDILVFYMFITLIVSKKYLRPLDLKKRKIALKNKDMRTIIGLYTANILLYYLLQTPAAQNPGMWTIPLLLSKYLSLLMFLYLAALNFNAYPEIKEKATLPRELFLINPLSGGILNGIASLFLRNYPPVFVVLKALTPKHYGFREFNRVPWHNRYYEKNKLVAITCYTSNSAEAYKIAKEFRKRGSKVIMGGPHVMHLPEEALAYCDSVVIGEAEGVWREAIRDYENGNLKPKYLGAARDDDYREVHRELLNSPPEIIKDFLETTRGCKYRCHFCTIPALSGGKPRKKDIGEIIELLRKIKHKYKTVSFIDNNIYSDPAHAKKLFAALKPLRIKWTTQCTIDIAKNDEALRMAKESGCCGFLFGYEISGGSPEKQKGGKLAMAEKYIPFTKKIKKAGLSIKAHFIFGFDSDNFKSLFKLWRFCFSIHPMLTAVSLLTPLPGSQFYYDMLKEGRLINLNWRNYNAQHPVFKHPQMDHRLLALAYPFIVVFMLLTTSKAGHCLFALIFSIILWFCHLTWSPTP